MDRMRSGNERRPEIDLLNENLQVTFEIAPEAIEHLPVVTKEDLETGRERYRALLGTIERRARSAHLFIRGVFQEEQGGDEYGSYKEGIEEVLVDVVKLRDNTHRTMQGHQEFQGWMFVGDVHTHPKSGLAYPSEGDLRSMVQAYESGDFTSTEPYIFGIAAPHESGEMEYNFYRMVRTQSESGYGFKRLDRPQ